MNETTRRFAWLLACCATTMLGCSASTPDPSGSETHWLGTCPNCIHGAICENNVCVVPPSSPSSAAPIPTGSSPRPSTPVTDASFSPLDSSSGESRPPSNDRSPTDGGKFHVTPKLDGGGATPIATGLAPEAGFTEAGVDRTDSGPAVLTLFGAASGTLTYLPLLDIGPEPAPVGDDLQETHFQTTDDNLEHRRGVVEFSLATLKNVTVRRATLVMTQCVCARSPQPVPSVAILCGSYPADLVVAGDDYGRDTTPCGAFIAPQEMLLDGSDMIRVYPVDVTDAVRSLAMSGENLGVRFQLLDEMSQDGIQLYGIYDIDGFAPKLIVETQ